MTFTRTSLPSISYYFSRRSKKDLPFFPASCVQGSNNQRSWNPFQAVWPGWVLVSVSSILPQHGVKSSNFSWAVWSKIIYRFLLLRYCILSSWKSLILIIYQNKRNPKQILNISRHGLDWLGGGTIIGTAGWPNLTPSSAFLVSETVWVVLSGGEPELVMSCHGHNMSHSAVSGLHRPVFMIWITVIIRHKLLLHIYRQFQWLRFMFKCPGILCIVCIVDVM